MTVTPRDPGRRRLLAAGGAATLVALGAPDLARAETSAEARARRPELFDPETGLRIARYRAPTPTDAPGARVVDCAGLVAAIAAGAALMDVALDGAGAFFGWPEGWLGATPRATIPGALWVPGAGEGRLGPEASRYLEGALARLTPPARPRPVVAFCFADCWMSWNAALRLAARGGAEALWYPLGVDGWIEGGGGLARVAPFAPGG
jgi:PQQ-dependent catabolism-associated CXXCW motif protein